MGEKVLFAIISVWRSASSDTYEQIHRQRYTKKTPFARQCIPAGNAGFLLYTSV